MLFQGQLVLAATGVSPVIYGLVLLALRLSGSLPEDGYLADGLSMRLVGPLALAASIAMTGASWKLRDALGLAHSAGSQEYLRKMLVLYSINQTPAVAGFALALLSGNLLWPFLLMAVSIAAAILHFPSRRTLEQLEKDFD